MDSFLWVQGLFPVKMEIPLERGEHNVISRLQVWCKLSYQILSNLLAQVKLRTFQQAEQSHKNTIHLIRTAENIEGFCM